jgi:PAS domain S-box-containing protein
MVRVTDASALLRQLVTGVASEVSDAVVVTDQNFHVRSWNRGAERIYGWAESEVLGRHILDVLEWEGDDDKLASAWRSLEATDRWRGEGRQITRDGSTVNVWASATLVREENGTPVGVVSVNRPMVPTVGSRRPEPTTQDIADVRRGIDNDEFEVYYQPIVVLADARIIGVEALIRWHHPDRGLLAPAEFIPTAEHGGLIVELGGFVLGAACQQTAEWRRAGIDMTLAVNLSAKELADPLLADRITETAAATGLDLACLWLEITETALVDDVAEASALLHRLARLGVGISIDDFGTGWASLTYLRTFPVDVLKIDGAFVAGVDQHPNDAAIVRSILSLGAELDLVVVAEGIETVAQQQALQELGCAVGQGFLFGCPCPAAEVPLDRTFRIAAHVDAAGDAARPALLSHRHRVGAGAPIGSKDGSTGALSATGSLALTPDASALLPAVAHERTELDAVAGMLRALLRIRSAAGAAELLQRTVKQLGGTVVAADDAGPDALPIDVSLGVGAPLLVEVARCTVERTQLERVLPRLTEDARQAVDLLRRRERLEPLSA